MTTIFLSLKFWVALAFSALLAVIGGQQIRVSNARAATATVRAELAQTKTQYADAARVAQAAADALARANLNQQIEASNAAKTREKSLMADAAGARNAVDRLRVAIRDTDARGDSVPGSATVAGGFDRHAAGIALADCAAKYSELADTADRATSDLASLIASWPK